MYMHCPVDILIQFNTHLFTYTSKLQNIMIIMGIAIVMHWSIVYVRPVWLSEKFWSATQIVNDHSYLITSSDK